MNAGVEAVVEGDLVYTDEAEGSEPIAEVLKTRESESLTTSEEMETTEVLDEVVDADVTAGGPCKVKVFWFVDNLLNWVLIVC
jgi:hypothetical protein